MILGLSYPELNEEASQYFQDLGVEWIYKPLLWRNVEKKKGIFDWAQYDKEFQFQKKIGLKSIRYIGATPLWASSNPDSQYREWTFPPKDLEDWRNFILQVVKRYPKQEWAIWAEPDNTPPRESPSMVCFSGTAEDYFKMLKIAYETAKNEDPDSRIGIGGLVGATLNGEFPTVVENGRRVNKFSFFEELVKLGSEKYCDFVGLDLFAYGYGGVKNFITGIRKIRNLTKKPLLILETGAKISHPEGRISEIFHHEYVTEETQAGFLLKAYNIAKSAGVEKMFWLTLISSEWGLINKKGRKLSSYFVFKNLMKGDLI